MADLQTMLSYFLQDLLSGSVGTTLSTGYLAKSGSLAAPSFAFSSAQTSGLSLVATNPTFGRAGVNVFSMTSAGVSLLNTLALGWSTDPANNGAGTALSNPSTGVVLLSNGTATLPAEMQVSGGNGGLISPVKALTELTTIAAAATTSTAIQIPANAVVLAVSVRVVTVIPTAATFTVTSATPAKTWNTVAVPVAATSTDPGTAPGPSFQTTASSIVITPNLTPGAATGQVRVTIYYYAVTPATS